MPAIRDKVVNAAINQSFELTNEDIYDDIHKRHAFRMKTIRENTSLTEHQKDEAIKELIQIYDSDKILFKEGTKRNCENCNEKCLATSYCELCICNFLKENFSNWTSGKKIIDNLIRKCQLETLKPDMVIEWIPYENLQNIKYLTKGGCSEIYTADWIDGKYNEWDSKERILKRFGKQEVVLKRLENVEHAKRSWFEEANSHLSISNKWMNIVQCYGLTQDSRDGNYMLVMSRMDTDLREYLQKNHNKITWKDKLKIIINVSTALHKIYDNEKAIHRDLHSGNVLYSEEEHYWYISDLGFCGPANKPLESIYGNLPYIAPEVIAGNKHTIESDIYSIGMLMWEIASGQPPFSNYKHNYYLAMNIIYGLRPKIDPKIPLKYVELMKKCWNANPSERPKIDTLVNEIKEINKLEYNVNESSSNYLKVNENSSLKITSRLFTSKLHNFRKLPNPRNATEDLRNKLEDGIRIKYSTESYDDDNANLHPEDQDELEISDGKIFKIISIHYCFI
ncbi:kinase-like domain-containing protein [Glomus cerebriforme]|uniref:Kinase-like domain-containing protein n=1 Tax=Glomus cerebriforme TaxID=658196 RepID=A0A397TNR1_9GLOM|nr:kinase-like domain-containing protein [Glomus cerebriforme]